MGYTGNILCENCPPMLYEKHRFHLYDEISLVCTLIYAFIFTVPQLICQSKIFSHPKNILRAQKCTENVNYKIKWSNEKILRAVVVPGGSGGSIANGCKSKCGVGRNAAGCKRPGSGALGRTVGRNIRLVLGCNGSACIVGRRDGLIV